MPWAQDLEDDLFSDRDAEEDYPDELEADGDTALSLLDLDEEPEDRMWESAAERGDAALEAREVELEMIQEDIERRSFRKIAWEESERVSRVPFASWKWQRHVRRSWVREDLWRGKYRRSARAFARELDRRVMVMAMGEFRPWHETPAPQYRI